MWYTHTHTHTHTHRGILLSHKKEWNNAICNNMDGPRDYHTKWNKINIIWRHLHVESLKRVQMNILQSWYKLTEKPYLWLLKGTRGMDKLGNCLTDTQPLCIKWPSLVLQIFRICLQCRGPRFDPWVRKILWRRAWQPTPVFFSGEFHEQRSLACYRLRGRRKLNMTEKLPLCLFFYVQNR